MGTDKRLEFRFHHVFFSYSYTAIILYHKQPLCVISLSSVLSVVCHVLICMGTHVCVRGCVYVHVCVCMHMCAYGCACVCENEAYQCPVFGLCRNRFYLLHLSWRTSAMVDLTLLTRRYGGSLFFFQQRGV